MRTPRLFYACATMAVLALSASVHAAEKASEQVSKFFGSFSSGIQIAVPPYRGLEPRLALGYSSEGRNGTVGVGWGLSGFSTIERVNAGRGTPYFDANDTYVLDGQHLLPCVTGSTSPSCTSGGSHFTKAESFLKVAFDVGQNKFSVFGRDGTRTDFTPLIQTSYGTLRWAQTLVTDTKGNSVTYAWSCDSGSVPDSGTGDCYPGSVSYNGGHTITFYWELRPDKLSYGAASALRTTDKRLRSIIVALGTSKVRGIALLYGLSTATGRSLLTSAQMFGKDLSVDGSGLITGGTSLPAQTFAYQGDAAAKSFTGGWSGSSSSPLEDVAWTNGVNVTIWQNDVQKIPDGWDSWDGARATRALNGDGFVEFLSYTDGFKVMGLDGPDPDAGNHPDHVNFGIVSYDASNVYVKEVGAWIGPFGYGGPNWFRIEISGGVVSYKRRPCVGWGCTGASTFTTFHTSTVAPSFPLSINAMFHTNNSKYENAIVGGSLADATNWCPSHNLIFGDFNADGRTDAGCQGGPDGTGIRVTLSTGTGFGSQTQWMGSSSTAYRTGDFNGDGKTDIIESDGGNTFYVALSTGTSFGPRTNWGFINPCAQGSAEWGVGEVNGDGKSDIFCRLTDGGSTSVGISTGSSFSPSWVGNYNCTTGLQRVGLLDLDGDGKDDLYCQGMENAGIFFYRGTGSGFETTAITSLTSSFCDQDPANWVFGDFNADGRTDIACRWGKIALSTGRDFSIQGPYSVWCGEGGVGSTNFFAGDFDGDGSSEFVCNNNGAGSDDIRVRKFSNGTLQPVEVWKANWCSGQLYSGDFTGDGKADAYCGVVANAVAAGGTAATQADLLIDAANGLGGHVRPSYVNSTTFVNTNGPGPKWAVGALTTEDGRGWTSTNTYSYDGGLMDPAERRFLGFAHARETRPCLSGESQCPYTDTWFRQDLPAAGMTSRVENKDGAGKILTAQEFSYATEEATSNNPSKALLSAAISYESDGQSTSVPTAWPAPNWKRTQVAYSHDAYGNVTQSTNSGDMDSAGDEVTTTNAFFHNTSTYIVDKVAITQAFAGIGTGGTKLQETRIHYDGGSYSQPPSAGYATQIDRWLKSATEDRFVSSFTSYDAFGNPTVVTDETGRANTTIWDSTYHVYPVSATNAASETTTTAWDTICGVPSSTKSPNQQGTSFQTAFQTDALCRPTRTDLPLGGYEIRSYLNVGNPNSQHVNVETPPGGGTGDHYVRRYLDGLGRTYRKETRSATSGVDIVTTQTFNARGGVATTTSPFYSNETSQVTDYFYDPWNRLIRTELPDGNERLMSYGLWSTTTTDENGKSTTSKRNLGNPLQSIQERLLGSSPVTSTSTYDLLGRLTGMEDHLGHDWSWTFDSLGRNLLKVDPDAGTWSFVFDDAGRLSSQTDAKSQPTTFAYDNVGRLQTKTNAAGTVTTTYSESRMGFYNLGLPTTISSPSSVLKLDFDAEGKGTKQTRTLDSVDYVLTRAYDAGGFLRGITYPDGDAVGTTPSPLTYDAAGRLSGVPGIITGVTYNAAGQPLVQTNANGTETMKTYSPTRGFLTQILTTPGSPPIQNLQYTMNHPGLVGFAKEVTSVHANEGWSYGYDDLYRLTASTNLSTPAESQTFEYDAIGRITNNSRVGVYTYPSVGQARPHAPTQAGSNSYSYDNNGNLTAGAGQAPAWDANNRISSVTAGGTTVNFTYDANGERLKKTTATSTSLYPVEDYEIANGVVTKYINLKGLGVVAKRVTSGGMTNTFWLHKDRLGSVQAITDLAGAEVFRKKYRPYGETLAQSGSNTESLGWISERNDSETGFTYLHARYYSSGLGVFLSPDPLHPETQGVGLHRYGYGLGNPIGAIDRNGLASCAVADFVQETPNCSDSCSPAKDQLLDVVQPVVPWLTQECPSGSCAQQAIAELAPQQGLSIAELAPQKQMAITLLGCVDGSCVSKLSVWAGSQGMRSRPRAYANSDEEPEPIEIEPGPPPSGGGGGGDGHCSQALFECTARAERRRAENAALCLLCFAGGPVGGPICRALCMNGPGNYQDQYEDAMKRCQREYRDCVIRDYPRR